MVARRRAGHGIAPLWAAVASIVVSVGIAISVVAVTMSAVIAEISTLDYSG